MDQSYNAHSNVQNETATALIERLLPIGLQSIEQYNKGAVLDDDITIVDYGCAGAKNSVTAVDDIVAKVMAYDSRHYCHIQRSAYERLASRCCHHYQSFTNRQQHEIPRTDISSIVLRAGMC
jgi:ABC-type phosphonate transport system ATPase subunit